LHISKGEQKERFQARLDDPTKHWKFSLGDLPVRAKWNQYMAAYEDALTRCNTPWAPWYIVPANKKWYRNLAISNVIIDALEKLEMQYPESEADLDGVVIPD
jgi:polyphosphate kinase 2 (PPK2 family)